MDCGSLADCLARRGPPPGAALGAIAGQVLRGLVFLHREVGGAVGSGSGGVVVSGMDWGGDLEHFEWSDDVYWINIGRVVVFRVWALFLIFFF
jgi:hypothetical protein